MTDPTQDPQDPRAYFIIRDAAAALPGIFDSIRFEPLSQRHTDVVSVVALLPGQHFAGRHDIWLTLWHGHRDGTGKDGSGSGYWLRLDELHERPETTIHALDTDAAGFGLELPDTGGRDETLLEGLEAMLILLNTAIPVHRGKDDTALVFGALNSTLEEGFTGTVPADEEDTDLVEELEQLCADSDLEAVEFGLSPAGGGLLFSARAFVDASDHVRLTVWTAEDGTDWIDVAGRVQQLDSPELVFPGADQDEADMVADLAEQLAGIHDVAAAIFDELNPDDPDAAFSLLNAVAYAALNGGFDSGNPQGRRWHMWADQFGGHCKLGFLAGVMLEESPFGNLNIRATTMDPATRAATDLQVFWKQDDEADIPEHWLAVGTAAAPAHDGDPEHPDLLAGIKPESRDYIRHAIDHLHEMVHLAGSVLEARGQEVLAFVEARMELEAVPETVRDEMYRTAIDDAITGLNGIARLYTGAMPS